MAVDSVDEVYFNGQSTQCAAASVHNHEAEVGLAIETLIQRAHLTQNQWAHALLVAVDASPDSLAAAHAVCERFRNALQLQL